MVEEIQHMRDMGYTILEIADTMCCSFEFVREVLQ